MLACTELVGIYNKNTLSYFRKMHSIIFSSSEALRHGDVRRSVFFFEDFILQIYLNADVIALVKALFSVQKY